MGESRASVPSVNQPGRSYAPRNVIVSHPLIRGSLDIRWDDASEIDPAIIGYHVYRSQVELAETFRRVNRDLVQTNFFRDSLRDDVLVEDVSDQLALVEDYRGDPSDRFDRIGIDTSRWDIVDPDEVLSEQVEGLRFRDQFGLERLAFVESRFFLKGDFDVQLEYRVRGLDQPEVGESGGFLWIVLANGGGSFRIVRRATATDDFMEVERIDADGTVTSLVTRPTSSLGSGQFFGRFRAVRANGNITFAFDDGDEFVLLHTELDVGDDLVQMRIGGQSGSRDSDNTVVLDTFFEFRNWIVFEADEVKAWTSPNPNMWLRGGMKSPVEQITPETKFLIGLCNIPVVDDRGHARTTNDPKFVKVLVDDREAEVSVLNGEQGLVGISSFPAYDDILKRFIDRAIPKFGSKVTVEYRTNTNIADTSLDNRVLYRVTAVCCGGSETPLKITPVARLGGDGRTHWIWDEAVRRNKWILEQGGHRATLFIQKKVGERCPECYQESAHTHDHPRKDCNSCFGTGFVGGFEGPFDVLIAPPFAEMKIDKTERGHRFVKQSNTWMTATPLVSQRDFLVLRDGKCYGVGAITAVEIRNHTVLQQHFDISQLDTTDVRYRFIENAVYENKLPTEASQALKGTNQHPLGKEIRQDGSSRKASIRKAPGDITFENQLY